MWTIPLFVFLPIRVHELLTYELIKPGKGTVKERALNFEIVNLSPLLRSDFRRETLVAKDNFVRFDENNFSHYFPNLYRGEDECVFSGVEANRNDCVLATVDAYTVILGANALYKPGARIQFYNGSTSRFLEFNGGKYGTH